MKTTIQPAEPHDLAELQQVVVFAFEPIFASFKNVLGTGIYDYLFPDWQTLQRDLVAALCSDAKFHCYVARIEQTIAGFIAYHFHHERKTGEVELLFVHPTYQSDGIGTILNEFALTKFKEAGMIMAEVGTGGDEGHAPARRSYEKAGYTPFPQVRYFKQLD